MNKRSIMSILLILLALSLTLGAVSAEDIANDDVVAAEETAVVGAEESTTESATETATQGNDTAAVAAEATTDTKSADLAVDVEYVEEEQDGELIWSVVVTNNGPDTAVNTISLVNAPDSLFIYEYATTHGEFDLYDLIWDIGDLAKDEQAILLLGTYIIGEGPYYIEAIVVSETPDPDLSNNYDIAYLGGEEVSAASEETLHETGNPIAMALLALLVVGVGGLKRKI